MSSTFAFSTVDVFTRTPFTGNQLGIIHVPHDANLSQKTKQSIAREFNFSESVFLYDAAPDSTDRRLDIFTTTAELPFAGHPTIGTLCYVCQSVDPPLENVKFITKAGPIVGRYEKHRRIGEADIPHNVRIHKHLVPSMAVLRSQPKLDTFGESEQTFPVVSIVKGMSHMLVALSSDCDDLEKLDAQSQKIEKGAVIFDEGWAPSFVGVYYYVIEARRSGKYHIRARMLEESIGEDAATGSAASCLAVYMALQDGKDDEAYEFGIVQGVAMGRASSISVKVELQPGGKEVKKVLLGGSAVLVTEGTLHVPESAV